MGNLTYGAMPYGYCALHGLNAEAISDIRPALRQNQPLRNTRSYSESEAMIGRRRGLKTSGLVPRRNKVNCRPKLDFSKYAEPEPLAVKISLIFNFEEFRKIQSGLFIHYLIVLG